MRWVHSLAVLVLAGCAAAPSATGTPSALPNCQWSATWGQPEGAAGTEYRTLRLTNTGSQPCTLTAVPVLTLLQGATQVASVAAPADPGVPLTVPVGATLVVTIGTANPDNFPAADCQRVSADHLSVAIADEEPLTMTTDLWPACTHAGTTPFIQQLAVETA